MTNSPSEAPTPFLWTAPFRLRRSLPRWLLAVGCLLPTTAAHSQLTPIGNELGVYEPMDTNCPKSIDLAVDVNGNFVVVWDRADHSLMVRLGSSDGFIQGSPKVLFDTGNDSRPAVAMAADRSFVMVWRNTVGLKAQRYSPLATPVGSVIDIAGQKEPDWPDISVSDAGDFVVAWRATDNGIQSIWSRRYDSAGQALGAAFQVNSGGTVVELPNVAMEPDGDSFLVSWGQDGATDHDIKARRYDSSGNPVGSEMTLNNYLPGNQLFPSASMTPTGSFVASWHGSLDANSNNSEGVLGSFTAAGAAGSQTAVGDGVGGDVGIISAVSSDGGTFVTAFYSDPVGPPTIDSEIHLTANAQQDWKLGGPFAPPIYLRMAMDDREMAVVAWMEQTAGSCPIIKAKRLQVHRKLNVGDQAGQVYSLRSAEAWKYYTYAPTANPARLTFTVTTDPGQDVDVYLGAPSFPDKSNFYCRPFLGPGTPETCTYYSTGGSVALGINGFGVGPIDFNIRVTEEAGLFFDGFEAGNTSAWSATQP